MERMEDMTFARVFCMGGWLHAPCLALGSRLYLAFHVSLLFCFRVDNCLYSSKSLTGQVMESEVMGSEELTDRPEEVSVDEIVK